MAGQPQPITYEKIREVYKFMNSVSKQRKEVVHFFSKKWSDEGYFSTDNELSKQRTVDNYIRKVKQTYLNYESEIETEKGRQLARLDDLYAKNIKIQDYKAALGVLREINDMLGLKAPTKQEITGNISGTKVIVENKEQADLIEQLKKKESEGN